MRTIITKREVKNTALLLAVSIALVFALSFSFAATVSTTSKSNVTQNDAGLCINDSTQIMADMAASGLNTIRVNDTLKEAQALYDSQVVLHDKKRNYDFSLVIPYCNAIKQIKADSIMATDEFSALLKFYNDSIVPGMNTSSIDALVSQAQSEITSERYELVSDIVNEAYTEIIDVKSSYTSLNIFISSTTTGLRKFIVDNWKVILTLLVLGILFFMAYRIKIFKWITERKINSLMVRKNTLKNLIMKTQKSYFQLGTIAEGEYNIKTKKFAELVRDIDRQIPLLEEELIKLERKSSKASNKSLIERTFEKTAEIGVIKIKGHYKNHVKTKKISRGKKKKY